MLSSLLLCKERTMLDDKAMAYLYSRGLTREIIEKTLLASGMNHTQECIEETIRQDALYYQYVSQWPNYCRGCQGYGMLGSSSIDPQRDTSGPCPQCTEKGLCARCKQPGLTSEERGDSETGAGPCKLCGWNYKDGLPYPVICLCHLNEETKENIVETKEKLAIVDLDKIVFDSSIRFNAATRPDNSINWRVALDPALVRHDTLILGAEIALDLIQSKGYKLLFLTGRPEKMRQATVEKLAEYLITDYELIMRPDGNFTKAPEFKYEKIAEIVASRQPETLIFIDDLVEEYPNLLIPIKTCPYYCYASLSEFIGKHDFSELGKEILGKSDEKA
jgi:hypothetical protein